MKLNTIFSAPLFSTYKENSTMKLSIVMTPALQCQGHCSIYSWIRQRLYTSCLELRSLNVINACSCSILNSIFINVYRISLIFNTELVLMPENVEKMTKASNMEIGTNTRWWWCHLLSCVWSKLEPHKKCKRMIGGIHQFEHQWHDDGEETSIDNYFS